MHLPRSRVVVAVILLPLVAGQTCSTWSGRVIGSGFIKTIDGVASAAACCSQCFDYGYSCAAWTLDGTTCFLKDNAKGNASDPGRISGTTGSAPGPTPSAVNRTMATRACRPPYDKTSPWCDTSKTIDDRVDALIAEIDLSEIPALLTAREGGGGSPGPSGAIARLGLPEYDWGVNCIHGVQTTCINNTKGQLVCPTSFPNPNSLGAGFNSSMWKEMGRIIGYELRALWINGATEASSWSGKPHAGLDCWSPNINIARDPRWGRNQEVPSEDPYMNGVFGVQYTQGLQRNDAVDAKRVQAIVTMKHWDAYTLEDADGFTRHNFDAKINNYTLADTFLPAWRASIVEGDAKGVMCSYNAINGVPTCANKMLNTILRERWNFSGYITGDSGAVADIYTEHKYVADSVNATCKAMDDGGCDVCSGHVYHDSLVAAVTTEACMSNATMLRALHRTLKLRFELGLFDPADEASNPLWHVSADEVQTPASQATNMLATLEGMILLKNEKATLPLKKGGAKLLVVGPHGNAQGALVGNYLGVLCPNAKQSGSDFSCIVSPASAMGNLTYVSKVTVVAGSGVTTPTTGGIDAAVAAASESDIDAVVLMLGIDEKVEAESHDRSAIDLPQCQHDLAKAVAAAAAKSGKPVVVVLLNGGMVSIAEEKADANIGAIVEALYPGFYGGVAIAQTIFGENDHLGGKLPWTIYTSDFIDTVKMSNMDMVPDGKTFEGRTYKYYTGSPIYPAFYGLSLTKFTLSDASAQQQQQQMMTTTKYSIVVKNVGAVTGDEVVCAFFTPPKTTLAGFTNTAHLKRQLWGFERVHLAPGASATVTFTLDLAVQLRVVSDAGDYVTLSGDWSLVFDNGNGASVSKIAHVGGVEEGVAAVVERFPGAELLM